MTQDGFRWGAEPEDKKERQRDQERQKELLAQYPKEFAELRQALHRGLGNRIEGVGFRLTTWGRGVAVQCIGGRRFASDLGPVNDIGLVAYWLEDGKLMSGCKHPTGALIVGEVVDGRIPRPAVVDYGTTPEDN